MIVRQSVPMARKPKGGGHNVVVPFHVHKFCICLTFISVLHSFPSPKGSL